MITEVFRIVGPGGRVSIIDVIGYDDRHQVVIVRNPSFAPERPAQFSGGIMHLLVNETLAMGNGTSVDWVYAGRATRRRPIPE